jgi:hypothetical protein
MSPDHPSEEPTAIRTNLGAIFVSLELSRSTWLITSVSPGGEKMSKHGVSAGNIVALLARLSELKRKAFARTGKSLQGVCLTFRAESASEVATSGRVGVRCLRDRASRA